ncbi:hypothetical protein ACSDR0_45935 [Streptosporangium sp. G11]|uniref:hypothetical protein n=1 Tax=Streptosporangium sp. G11 TaxID=3436926 RepID=UPI003EBE074B
MEDSAEPISLADGQARDSFLIGDRLGDGTQRGRLGKDLMGAVVPPENSIHAVQAAGEYS